MGGACARWRACRRAVVTASIAVPGAVDVTPSCVGGATVLGARLFSRLRLHAAEREHRDRRGRPSQPAVDRTWSRAARGLPLRKHAVFPGRIVSGGRPDQRLLERLNVRLCDVAESVLARFQQQFSLLITEVVQRWDADVVTEKIETELGPDLQFIRLNGSLVGGAARRPGSLDRETTVLWRLRRLIFSRGRRRQRVATLPIENPQHDTETRKAKYRRPDRSGNRSKMHVLASPPTLSNRQGVPYAGHSL